MKNIDITIGIPAYNAQKNIQSLLRSLLNQSYINLVDTIIVHSDASHDKTVQEAKKINNPKIKIIEAAQRKGLASAIKTILKNSRSKVIIIVNDDIQVDDLHFIEKVVKPFKNPQIGLVTANPQPVKGVNFMEKAAISGFRVYEKMRYGINNGQNQFTCDGKVLALSDKYTKSLRMPKDNKKIGNVDAYLYFDCLKLGFKYKHIRNAIVYFKMPASVRDYLKLAIRNNTDIYILKKKFGKIVEDEYTKPKMLFTYAILLELIKNPIGVILLIILSFYILYMAKISSRSFNPTWDLVLSTKNIHPF